MCYDCVPLEERERTRKDLTCLPTECGCEYSIDCACGDGKGNHYLFSEDEDGTLNKEEYEHCICERFWSIKPGKSWKCVKVCQNCVSKHASKSK